MNYVYSYKVYSGEKVLAGGFGMLSASEAMLMASSTVQMIESESPAITLIVIDRTEEK